MDKSLAESEMGMSESGGYPKMDQNGNLIGEMRRNSWIGG
jgi:hypothetical protein